MLEHKIEIIKEFRVLVEGNYTALRHAITDETEGPDSFMALNLTQSFKISRLHFWLHWNEVKLDVLQYKMDLSKELKNDEKF